MFGLTGCEFLETSAALISSDAGSFITNASDKVMEETAERVEDYCDAVGDKMEERKHFVDGVNSRMDLRSDGSKPHLVAQDCDGDGKSDF